MLEKLKNNKAGNVGELLPIVKVSSQDNLYTWLLTSVRGNKVLGISNFENFRLPYNYCGYVYTLLPAEVREIPISEFRLFEKKFSKLVFEDFETDRNLQMFYLATMVSRNFPPAKGDFISAETYLKITNKNLNNGRDYK